MEPKGAVYLIEYYTDVYRTLHQAIMTDLRKNKISNGNELLFNRSRVNPNLKILYEREYVNLYYKPLKIERLYKGKWYDVDINTYEIIKESEREEIDNE